MATIRDFFVKQGAQANATLVAGVNLTNQLTLAGGASGSPGIVSLTASGGDPNISVNIVTKGTGQFLVNGSPVTVTPAGTNGQVQYNNSGAFGAYPITGTAGSVVMSSSPSITGGTHTAITSLGLRNIGTGAFDLTLAVNTTMTAGHTLTFITGDANRNITMSGDLSLAANFTTAGANALTLTTSGATNVTLPTTGTLATIGNVETFTNKTLTTPQLNGATVQTAAAVTAGTNAQGQGALTADYNVITTNASNPGGVTLPTATVGRWIVIVNKSANPVNIYPATGGAIDSGAANASINIVAGGRVEFLASSTTQWYSSANNVDGSGILTLAGNLTTSGAFTSTFTMTGNTTVTFPTSGTLATTSSNITGSAGSVANALTINNGGAGAASGATFNGSAPVTISYNTVGAPSATGTGASGSWGISVTGSAGSVANAVTFNNGGAGAASGTTYNGSAVQTISYNTIGAPSTTGTNASGTWGISISGNAATATKVGAAVTFNNSNTGAASGTVFDGSAAQTISANTIGAVALSGGTMTGFLTLSADPTQALHAATKQYVDAVKTGLDFKDSVRVGTTATLTITARTTTTLTVGGTSLVLDGVTLNNNDRVLVKNTTTGVAGAGAADNGIYTVGGVGSSIVLTRSTDADSPAELNGGMFAFIEEGTVNADTGWVMTNDTATTPITLGTTALTFAQFSGAGSFTAGNGLVLSGTTFHFQGSGAYTVGDIFYASSASAVGRLADVATGNVLISGGAAAAPAWGKVGLTTHVSGVLPVANGGTNQSAALTQGGVIYAASSTAMACSISGSSGNILISQGASAPTWGVATLASIFPDAWVKTSVKVASTAQQALSGTTSWPTIDGISTWTAGDRVLLRAQTTASENGIYVVGGTAASWTLTRVADMDAINEASGAAVVVDQGTANAGRLFRTDINATNTLGTTNMNWYEVLNVSHIGNASYVPSPTGTGASGTWGISISGNAATATNATNSSVTDDTTTNATVYPTWVTATSGNLPEKVSSTKLTFNPSTGVLTASGGFNGNATSATTATTATNANNTAVTDDTTTNATVYPTWVTANTGNLPEKVSSTKFTFNPSTGVLTASGGFNGNATTATTATNANNSAITDDNATNATMYVSWFTSNSGNLPEKVSSTKLTFNPSTGILTIAGGASLANTVAVATDTTNATYGIAYVAGTGSQAVKINTAGLTFNPSTNALTATGALSTNGTVTGANLAVGAVVVTSTTGGVAVAGTTPVNVDTFATATYRSARYTFQVSDGTNYEMCDVLVCHNGTTAYVTVFGNVFTGTTSMGDFDASIATGTLTLTYTAVAASSKTLKWIRTVIAV